MNIAELLPRPVGRPSQKPLIEYKGFLYQAASWKTARRVVAKVEHHAGELFPRVGSIVTNLTLPSRGVVRFYNKRGTSEQWIAQGIRKTHGSDEAANVLRHFGPPGFTSPAFPGPIQTEPSAVPGDHRFGLHHKQRGAPL
jgi:hypothetical protein